VTRPRSIAAAVFGLSLLSYLWTLCPSVYTEGSGELIGATFQLGTPHPTGYPLYVLLGRVLTLLMPLASPAQAVNAATALVAAAAAAALGALLRQRGCDPAAAAAGGLVLAWSRTFWSQAVVAEVYGLFVLTAVVAIAAGLHTRSVSEAERPRWLLGTGYAAGVAATCHLQAVLLLPLVVGCALWRRASGGRGARDLSLTVVGALAGLSVYLYLPVRNGIGGGFHWAALGSGGALWDHISGALYRTSFGLPGPAVLAGLTRWGHQLAGEWTPLFLPVVLLGAVGVWRRDRPLAVVLLAAITLNLATGLGYHRDPTGLSVFFLLTILCAAALSGFGLDALVTTLRPVIGRGTTIGVSACAAFVFLANATASDRSRSTFPDRFGRHLLTELPKGAVLLTEGDDASYLVDYLHRVEGLRPDVTVAHRLGHGAGSPIPPGENRRRQSEWVASGRPVHFLAARQMPVEGYRFEPWGLTYRAVPDSDSGTGAARRDPLALLSKPVGASETIEPWVYRLVSHCWYMEGEGRRLGGRHQEALAAYEQACQIAPRSYATAYNVSVVLLRMGRLEASLRYARRAIDIDPLRLGSYQVAEEILARLGRTEDLADLSERARVWARFP
jgi:hypothetical protein